MRTTCIGCFAVLMTLFLFSANGRAEPWTISIDSNVTLTQTAYSDNWAGGESGSFAWTFMSNSVAEKKLSERVNNKNTLKLYFGQTHNQDSESKDWGKPKKATDLIDFESVFRYDLQAFVDPFISGRLESQFYDQRDPDKKRYFNPVTLTESAGVAKVFIKEEHREWSMRIGGGLREHIDRDVLDPVKLTRDLETSFDGGFEFVNDFKTPLAGGAINLSSKLIVFQALFNSESDDLKGLPEEDYWRSPDVNWENIFTANITKYIMVNIYTQLLYDKEIAKGGRFKQTMGLGLAYKFDRP